MFQLVRNTFKSLNYIKKKPCVLAVLPAKIPSTIIGVVKPLSNLAKKGKIDFDFVIEHEVLGHVVENRDVIVFCRNTEPDFCHIFDAAVAKQIPMIYELDDNFWELPLSTELGRYYRSPIRIKQLERYITFADLLRVYSQPLFERITKMNQNVYLTEAGVDFELLPKEPPPKEKNKVRIVYASGRGEQDNSFKIFLKDLLQIIHQYADKVEILFWGYCPDEFKDLPSVTVYNIISDYEKFFYKFARSNFDIGLAPLPNTTFYRSKSNNKFREYGACRIAGIYSNVDVYSNCVKDGKTGLLIDNAPGECFHAIKNLLLNEDLRNDIQKRAYEFVYNNYRQEIIEKEWLKHITLVLKSKMKHQNYVVIPNKQNWSGIHCRYKQQVGRIVGEILTRDKKRLRRSVGRFCNSKSKHELKFEFPIISNSCDREFLVRFNFNDKLKKKDRPEPTEIKLNYSL